MSSSLAFQDYWADDFTPLQAAGKNILRELREDEAEGDLHRQLVRGGSHLYFESTQTRHVRSVPLPRPVQNEIKTTKSVSLMGLFPQAKLAWTTVDHKLFIWGIDQEREDHRMDLSMNSGQCIVSVGLAPPKRDVFSKKVEWVLVVSTFDEVLLCAIARQDNGQLGLVETRYTLPTDSNPIITTCGLPNGRLFMGGKDSCLYEFDYESIVDPTLMPAKTPEQLLDEFYDGNATTAVPQEPSLTAKVFATGKRAASQILNGSDRPKKCRKLNHSNSVMSRVIASVVPDVLRKIPSSVGNFLSGEQPPGPIIKIVHDPERATLYSLSERGIINVFDVSQETLQHKSRLDTQRAAHKYLTLLSKGHMHITGTTLNPIEFLGGGTSARAGVGGIDGARAIVKSSVKNLTPVHIHVLPRRESNQFTLLAVTAGGLRLYMTALRGGQTTHTTPSSRLTLCHIRAPPPINPATGLMKESYEEIENIPGGIPPRLMDQTVVDSVAYSDGHFFLALQPPKQNGNGEIGNLILATNPDCMGRKIKKQDDIELLELPGGITEMMSLPAESKLPGGRLMDSCFVEYPKSPMIDLMLKSRTPTDGELGVGLVPAYNPRTIETGKPKREKKEENTSNQLVPMSQTGSLERSILWTVIANFLTSRPLATNIRYRDPSHGTTSTYQPNYRISTRYGCNGFSSAAGRKIISRSSNSRSSGTHQAARLSPWLLRAPPVPLKQLAIAHALPSKETVALSVGGVHYFKTTTILESLIETLMSARTDVILDKSVNQFFTRYGVKQGCALCLIIAMGCGPAFGGSAQDTTNELKTRAKRAALGRARSPNLVAKAQTTQGRLILEASSQDKAVPDGYDFIPSFLFDGLASVLSRLLRPFWFKPAVVVTEGRVTQAYGRTKQRLPAKVELLLDDTTTLYEVRQPLIALQKFIQEVFVPAINVVPGIRTKEANSMDISSGDNYITNGILYQSSLRNNFSNSESLSPETREKISHLIEERNIHSLYRLVSRTIQLLNLLELLKRAQFMPELPEVEWGLIHGLTVCQLVQDKGGHERVEALLNTLVSNHKARIHSMATPSADSDELARQFACQCYLYFSPGTNHTMIGFRAARDALNCSPASSGRETHADVTVKNLKQAASYWTNAQLVSGRIMHSDATETIEQKALRAFHSDSPLAKAADVLIQLGKVEDVVEICRITASNFGNPKQLISSDPLDDLPSPYVALPWEKTLYHMPTQGSEKGNATSSSDGRSAIVIGTNVTSIDAISSCHAIILFHLNDLLKSTNYDLARRMLTACATFPDKDFLTTMFDFLLKKDMVDALLSIKSIDLEKWLKTLPEFDLLRRFYIVHGKYSFAADLMWEKAVENSQTVPLNKRIEYLSESVKCFKTAKLGSEASDNTRDIDMKIRSAEDHLDLARLQDMALKEILGRKLEDQLSDDKMQCLRMSLLEASEFYNDYMAELNLFEGCLRILHHCRHHDSGRIEMLWKSVIFDEIYPVATRQESALRLLQKIQTEPFESEKLAMLGPNEPTNLPLFERGEWIGTLMQKVEKLGYELYGKGADYMFPVEFLAVILEELRYTQNIHARPWPIEILLNVNVSYDKILDAFEARIRQEERHLMGGADPLTRYLHLRSIVELIEHWVGSRSERARKELTLGSVRLSNQIDAIKIALGELYEVGDEVAMTRQRLERVHERMLQIIG